jgi:hypothetical protein
MMKQRIKGFILGLFVLAIFMFIFSLIIPTRIGVSKGIPASVDSVKAQLVNIKNWQYWYKPLLADTNIAPMFSASTTSKGAWVNYGENTITITDVTPQEVLFEVTNANGQHMPGGFNIVAGVENTTEVYWYFKTANKWFPWQRLRSIALEKIMKPEMRSSLDNLEKVAVHGYVQPGALMIEDDYVDDAYLIATRIQMDSSTFFNKLFTLAKENRDLLLTSGIKEEMLSKAFYITGAQNNFEICWGIKEKEFFFNDKPLNIIDHSNGKKQLSISLQKNITAIPIAKLQLANYARTKAYVLQPNKYYIKVINWQYATSIADAQIKVLVVTQ